MPEKEEFYSNLNMKIATDAGYMQVKRVCRVFEITNLGKYHDLYIKSNALLSTDVFENCRKICFEIYQNWLAWQPVLKKTKIELLSLFDFDMLLMIEKELKAEYVILLLDMQKLTIIH